MIVVSAAASGAGRASGSELGGEANKSFELIQADICSPFSICSVPCSFFTSSFESILAAVFREMTTLPAYRAFCSDSSREVKIYVANCPEKRYKANPAKMTSRKDGITPMKTYVTMRRFLSRQSSLEEDQCAARMQASSATTKVKKIVQPLRALA